MKLRYEEELVTCETFLKAIGRDDIPSTDISILTGIDEETGAKYMEIDMGKHKLGMAEKIKVAEIAAKQGCTKEVVIKAPLEGL